MVGGHTAGYAKVLADVFKTEKDIERGLIALEDLGGFGNKFKGKRWDVGSE